MNQNISKHINLLITIVSLSLIAGVALALKIDNTEYIDFLPTARRACDAIEPCSEGMMYYDEDDDATYVWDGAKWISSTVSGNISPATVTTTDGQLWLNTGEINHEEGDIYKVDHVYGYNDLRLHSSFNTSNYSSIYLGDGLTDKMITFYIDGDEKMKIDSTGNVIVNQNLTVTGNTTIDGTLTITGLTCTGGDCIVGDDIDESTLNCETITGSADLCDGVDAVGSGYWTQSGTNLYTNNTGWNVGIGTTNPLNKLQVSTPTNSNQMTLGSATGVVFSVVKADEQYGLYAGVSGDGDPWLQAGRTNTATAYNLNLQASGGSLGVGTVSPLGNTKLDVNGVTFLRGRVQLGGASTAFLTDTITGFTEPNPANDAFLLVPGYTSTEDSDLRLYMLDNPERFSIWSDSCGGGSCGDINYAGLKHYFDGSGNAYHEGDLTVTGHDILMGGADWSIAYNSTYPDHGIFYDEGSPDKIVLSPDGGGKTGTNLVVSGNGNVGIGTTSPSEELTIKGTDNSAISLVIPGEDKQTFINWFTRDVDGDGAFETGDKGWHVTGRGNTYSTTNQRNDLMFWKYDSGYLNVLTLDNAGNVGIGRDNPANKLHVSGNIGATGWIGAGCESNCETSGGYVINYGGGNTVGTSYAAYGGGIRGGGTGNPSPWEGYFDGQVYVNDYLRADGGIHVGGSSDPGTDNLIVDGHVGIGTSIHPNIELDVAGDIMLDGYIAGPPTGFATPILQLYVREKKQYCVWALVRCDPPSTSYPSCPSSEVSGEAYGPLYTGISCTGTSSTCPTKHYKTTYRPCLRLYAAP